MPIEGEDVTVSIQPLRDRSTTAAATGIIEFPTRILRIGIIGIDRRGGAAPAGAPVGCRRGAPANGAVR